MLWSRVRRRLRRDDVKERNGEFCVKVEWRGWKNFKVLWDFFEFFEFLDFK